MIRTPNVHEQFDFGFFGPPDNFHFSKVANFCSFCEARSKMASNKRRATKYHILKIACFTVVCNCFVLRFYCGFKLFVVAFLLRLFYCRAQTKIGSICTISRATPFVLGVPRLTAGGIDPGHNGPHPVRPNRRIPKQYGRIGPRKK